jgi:hypothetical protein
MRLTNQILFHSKKGEQGLAAPFYAAIGVVLAVIILAVVSIVSFNIMGNMEESSCTGTGYLWNTSTKLCMHAIDAANYSNGGPHGYNATRMSESGLSSLMSNTSLWVLVAGAAITLSILFVGLGVFMYMKNQ